MVQPILFGVFHFRGEGKEGTEMYFIDHLNKKIHDGAKAGDACGFIGTPSEAREFSDSEQKIAYLKENEQYMSCAHCSSDGLKVFPYNTPPTAHEE